MTGDIRWPRRLPAITSLPTTRHYQELLDRKDIDCIVAAVPDHWHERVVVDACNAGKDIYCEKPMSHTVADGFAMVEAAQKNNRIVQIGSQRVSSVLCATKARDLYQERRNWRRGNGGAHAGAKRSDGRVGISAAVSIFRPRRWIGIPGSTMRRRFHSISFTSRAGAAGGLMAPAWPAT